MAEKSKKDAGETEKTPPASVAEPSARKAGEGTVADYRDASQALFGVPPYVLVGAAKDAGYEDQQVVSETDMRGAVETFLGREVKE